MTAPLVVHLISSPFYGGPERQIVGLSTTIAPVYGALIAAFPDRGKSRDLIDAAGAAGIATVTLAADAPRYARTVRALVAVLRDTHAVLLCTHHYKADLVGRAAAWMAGIPCVAVAHGWTASTPKVRLNEALDRGALHLMEAVVCVSEAQARKVRRLGIARRRIRAIPNAIDPAPYGERRADERAQLEARFTAAPRLIVGAIGRLSPEKGFDVLVDAAARVVNARDDVGFVVFGDGPERDALQARIGALGLERRVVLGGFQRDVPRVIGAFDLVVLPSRTEGMPVVALEAMAGRVPVVATAVGGTPEVLGSDAGCGMLAPPNDPPALASAILDVLADDARRSARGEAGRRRVEASFTRAAQARAYATLFESLLAARGEKNGQVP